MHFSNAKQTEKHSDFVCCRLPHMRSLAPISFVLECVRSSLFFFLCFCLIFDRIIDATQNISFVCFVQIIEIIKLVHSVGTGHVCNRCDGVRADSAPNRDVIFGNYDAREKSHTVPTGSDLRQSRLLLPRTKN